MKILQINKYHYLRGGSERVFFNTSRLLEEHGHRVIHFSVKHPQNIASPYEEYFPDAPEIRDLPALGKIKAIPRFLHNPDAARCLEKLITDERPDIAHLHNIFNGLSLAILPVLHKHGIPVVITLHDTRIVCPSTRFMLHPDRCMKCRKTLYTNCLLHRCSEGSMPISFMTMLEMMHTQWVSKFDRYIDKYILLNSSFLDMLGSIRPELRRKGTVLFNFNAEMPEQHRPHRGDYFLFYGRLSEEKGVRTLMRAIKSLPDIKFRIVGTGPLEDLVREMSLPNLEYSGYLSGQALQDAIDGASYIVVPSEWMENNPMTIIEAASAGKPVIASRIGGIPDIVVEGETGFMHEPFDADALVAAIRLGAGRTDARYEEMSRNAARFALDNFHPDRHYDRLMQIYTEALNSK